MTDALEGFCWRGDPAEIVAALDVDEAYRELVRWIEAGRPAWHADAACRTAPTEWFFPTHGQTPRRALELCGRCPVLADCRTWALDDPTVDGVAGGMTARARKAARGLAAKRKADRGS